MEGPNPNLDSIYNLTQPTHPKMDIDDVFRFKIHKVRGPNLTILVPYWIKSIWPNDLEYYVVMVYIYVLTQAAGFKGR